jgi:predicted extracellular nuclease
MRTRILGVILAVLAMAISANANVLITEWMYQGTSTKGEFVELTNIGSTSVDMTGWSFDDNHRTAGTISLNGFGTVNSGESVILTEDSASSFRTAWNLDASVKIIGGYSNHNLGRADEINIYDSAQTLVDRLTFDDQTYAGSIRTQNKSGNIPFAALGQNNVYAAVLSATGDSYGSYTSTGSDLGNPGHYVVPEPTTLLILGLGAMLLKKTKYS